MFSVYGKAGRVFRGSMEELRRVGAAAGLTRTRGLSAVGQEGRDHGSDSGFSALMAVAPPPAPADLAHRVALAAYTEVRKTDTPRQPLTKVESIMSSQVVLVPDSCTIEHAWL